MNKLAALATCALLVPAPALAEEVMRADLVAKFLFGAADGASFINDIDFSLIKLERSGPGSFGGKNESSEFAVAVAEGAEPCVFDITLTYSQTPQPMRITFDANQLAGITYTSDATLDFDPPVTSFVLQFNGGERLVTLPDQTGADGQPQVGPQQVQVMTSLPLAELEAALAQFRTDHCPGVPS